MTPGARLAAAIEVLEAIERERRPAADALKSWGLAHRFAGSGDRAAIGGLVYDALRRRASSAHLMDADTPRAVALGMLKRERGLDAEAIARLADGSGHAPPPLTDAERGRLASATLEGAPAWIAGDYPEWLDPQLARTFGDGRAEEGAALGSRAPLDLRVNTLKAELEQAQRALEELKPDPTPWSPLGLRVRLGADAKAPAIHAEPAFIKGMVEVQDEGSQLAALLVEPAPGMRVCDFCAGAGGKSLAMAAAMNNKGHIVACDVSGKRLEGAVKRLRRAGVFNVEQKSLSSERDPWVKRHRAGFDRVLVDAPCTGTGTWRRNPDAKWTLTAEDAAELEALQRRILDSAARLVKPGGRIIYATCSLLPQENEQQAAWFAMTHPEFTPVSVADIWSRVIGNAAPADGDLYLQLSPARHNTDGFFAAVFEKTPERAGTADKT
jgi:16S rRNA (cytosine967-C5)-methyltransferase